MRVWLTGAQGMLGRFFRAKLDQTGIDCVGTDAELDIGQQETVREFTRTTCFSHIINCAAFTQVDQAESNESEAFRANAEGPVHLGIVARETGAALLHFSTDYVFDGLASAPYTEEDACAPRTVYGRSKLDGEQRLRSMARQPGGERWPLFIVRSSWLFGEGRSSFVSTMLRLMTERETLSVVEDQVGRPTYAKDLSAASLALIGLAAPKRASAPGLYHFANSGATSWYEFTRRIWSLCRELGYPVKTKMILPISMADYPYKTPRPQYSVLSTERIERSLGIRPRPWEEALREHLVVIAQQPRERPHDSQG
jgi:dTDP-4-dehydrorhamnose reductase